MKRYLILIFFVAISYAALAQAPIVSSFSPVSGPAGTAVTINGSGFGASAADNVVYFGGGKANVISASSTSITVTVPYSATYQPISVINKTTGLQAVSTKSFITASNKGEQKAFTERSFQRSNVPNYQGLSYPSLQLVDIDGDGKLDIGGIDLYGNKVQIYKNTSVKGTLTDQSFTLAASFNVHSYILYQIFDLNFADLNGDGALDMVMVYDSFKKVAVYINQTPGQLNSQTFNAVTEYDVPSVKKITLADLNLDGKVDILACTYDKAILLKNTTATASKTFSFSQQQLGAASSVTHLDAKDVDNDGKTDVVVSTNYSFYVMRNTTASPGTDFTYQATTPSSSGGKISKVADVDADGTNDIITLSEGGKQISIYKNTTSAAGNISFAPGVYINTTYPLRSLAVADITGDGFPDVVAGTTNSLIIASNKGLGSVDFNESVVLENADNRDVLVGDLDNDGKNDIVDVDWNINLLRNNIIGAPQITTFTPTSTWYFQTVSITGKNLSTTYKVTLGGVDIGYNSIKVVSNESVIITMPRDAKSGDIVLSTADGTVSASGFVFTDPPLPKVSSFTPTVVARQETVTITGEDFYGVTSVKFGGEEAASFKQVSQNTITAVVNEGATGDVTVTGMYGAGGKPGFVYKSVPMINFVSSSTGKAGQTITLTGRAFIGATRVTFGGIDVASFTVESNTVIKAVLGEGDSGVILVYNQFGVDLAGPGFKFDGPQPVITDFSPKKGNAGSIVKIKGNNFSTIPKNNHVYFGIGKAKVTSASKTELSVEVPANASYDVLTVTVNEKIASSVLPFTLTFAGGNDITLANYGSRYEVFGGNESYNMVIGDLDNDGKSDLVFSSRGNYHARLDNNESTVGKIAFGYQFNSKGLNDGFNSGPVYVAISNEAVPKIYMLNRNGDYTIDFTSLTQVYTSFYTEKKYAISRFTNAVYIKDMDGDGKTEPWFTGTDLKFPNAFLVDVDGDGKTDVVTRSATLPQISVYRNTSVPGTESYAVPVNISVGVGPVDIAAIDVNEDGKIDLAVSCKGTSPETTGSVIILKNTSSIGNITLNSVYTISGIPSVSRIAAGDINGDGNADLLVASGPKQSFAYKNISGSDIKFAGGTGFELPGEKHLSIVDMDGDGKPELCGLGGDIIAILRNTSGATGITSFSPTTATAGNEVTINGAMLSKVTSVTFGKVEAKSFTIVSDTQIKAIVGDGESGAVNVAGNDGNAFFYGFKYAGKPTIYPGGAMVFDKGGSVLLYGGVIDGATNFKWYKNGEFIAGATGYNYTATQTGKYTFSTSINGTVLVSDPVWVKVQYPLPANNFKISALSLTCKGADNGVIAITAEKELDYNVLIKGENIANTNYQFKKTKQITALKGGLYTLVFTLTNEPEFEQEFTIKVDQPKDLIVYQEVDPVVNTVMLTLEGGDKYNVTLNGFMYTTTASQLRLSLARGTNELIVTTDKDCQGVIKKLIKVDGAPVYPVPFTDWLNVDLGDDKAELVPVELLNIYGKVILSINLDNQNGKGRLNLSSIPSGTYVLKVRNKVYKIWKQ
nr:FG-GAP-like repeat-containing protein [uncultured Mucilaginibacter sp.]